MGRQNEACSRQRQKSKIKQEATEFCRSPAWTCDDHHPNFSPTFNVRVADGQVRQLHEVSDVRRNRPWAAAGGTTKLIVVRGRKAKSGKKQTIFADHPPGHVIAEPFALTREFIHVVHIEPRQLHELPDVRWNRSWVAAGGQGAAGGRQRQKNKFGKKATDSPITRLDM